jgi:hypothetical protein
MSEEQIRQRIIQEIATEIRRLVGLLETLTVDGERDREGDQQVVQAQVIPQQPAQAVAREVPQREEAADRNSDDQGLTIGARVLITNTYGGHRGQTGIVTRITPRQVALRLDRTGRVITKRKTSVTVITD